MNAAAVDLFGCRCQRLAHFIGEVLDKLLDGSPYAPINNALSVTTVAPYLS
jgi:hypothetical protein